MRRILPEEVLDQRTLLFPFFAVLLLLLGAGLVSLYSASYFRALNITGDPFYYVRRQAVFALLGIIGALVMAGIPYHYFRFLVPLVLAASLVLMLLTLLSPLGETRLGARRWMSLGPVSLQPSEVVKISVILFLANYLGKHGKRLEELRIAAVPVGVVLLFAVLIILQRDFSTALLFVFVMFSMIAVSRTKKIYLLFFLLLVMVPGIMLLLMEEYRLRRVIGFLFPSADPTGMNYQVNMSLRAVASGGFLGTGFGLGTMKHVIPEVSADFIFASFAEETGLAGVLSVWLLFAALGYIGYRAAAAHRHGDQRLFFLGFGCTSMIIWQALINMAVVIGAVPPTGLPLPFFSLGGTNLAMVLTMCGCIGRTVYAPTLQHSGYEELDSADYVLYK